MSRSRNTGNRRGGCPFGRYCQQCHPGKLGLEPPARDRLRTQKGRAER